MNPDFLSVKFLAAMPYAAYVSTGTAEQQRRWNDFYPVAHVTPAQKALVEAFTRQMKILIVSGIWCGDCVQQCPLIQKIAEVNPGKVEVRLLDRDVHKDLSDHLKINAGGRVPVVLFMAEDFHLCAVGGDRTISRYRAIARKQLGPSCPIALMPPDADEVAATMNDWVMEVERVHLMLRISPRLRQKYGD